MPKLLSWASAQVKIMPESSHYDNYISLLIKIKYRKLLIKIKGINSDI